MIVSRWENQGKKKDSPKGHRSDARRGERLYNLGNRRTERPIRLCAFAQKMPETQFPFRSDFRMWTKTMHLG